MIDISVFHYYQLNQKPYSISPTSIFGYLATHMIVKIFYYHVPPWYCSIPGGDMIVKMFYYHVPPWYCSIPGGDMIVKMFLLTCPPGIVHYYQFNQKPYSISPTSIFGYLATHMIVKMFLVSCPPLVLNNTRGGDMLLKPYIVFFLVFD